MEIRNGTFVVSGGASGLGAATARMLAGAGGNVVIADLKEDDGVALARELGARARFARCDVTDEASATAAVRAALSPSDFGYPWESDLGSRSLQPTSVSPRYLS